MLESAKKYLLDFILENEEVKKFPKDFVTASMQWIRSWFLIDDPVSGAILDMPGNETVKQVIVDQKLPKLLENEQFKKELNERIAALSAEKDRIHQEIITQKNVVNNSSINAGGNVIIGDKNTQAGGNIYYGDIIHNYGSTPASTPNQTSPIHISPEVVREWRTLVASARTGEVFKKLLPYIEQNAEHLQMEVHTLSARWEDLGRNERLGILSRGEANLERNQINMGLLDILGRL